MRKTEARAMLSLIGSFRLQLPPRVCFERHFGLCLTKRARENINISGLAVY